MKGSYLKFLGIFIVAALAIVPLLGCEGDTGPAGSRGLQGEPGVPGEPGEPGAPGVVLADVVPINPVLDLTRTVSYDAGTGALSIHFFLTDEDGNGIDITTDAYEMRVYVSELVPSAAADNPGPAWDQLFNERGTPAAGSPLPGTLTLLDAATGEYDYVCANTLAATTNVVRVTVRARWRETIDGVRYVFANPVNASYDFLESDPGTRLASSGADMVTTAACESCHGARIGDVGHGGGYTQVKTCNHCHNLNYQEFAEADLASLVHTIHSAGIFANITDHSGNPVDFSELTYPQHLYTCAKCHDGPEADLAYSNPTRLNCGSCHHDVDFATGVGHGGGPQGNDSGCSTCHPATGAINPPLIFPVQTVHDIAPTPENTSEFEVSIIMNSPANGQYWTVGEAPIVTVTLVDAITNTPVAGSVYNAPQDAEGVSGGGISTANLFAYGPRNEAKPVLATYTQHDAVFDPQILIDAGLRDGPYQSHSLFVDSTVEDPADPVLGPEVPDPLVQTDVTGFKYQLLPIPADMEPGTYMVRFEGADYGGFNVEVIGDGIGNEDGICDSGEACVADYVTSSSAVINFQVGTADVEPKVSGDACVDCHGATIMHLEGTHAHHAPFDTDHCLGCHDKSGNHGDYIGNRVHAVHKETITGDYNNRDWSEVTFPRPANNCLTCHTNTAVDTPVWRTPSMLACGGCHGVMPNAVLADYPAEQQDQVMREIGAAQHMEQNGGDADADAAGAPPTLSCLICHGEGRLADLYETHQLILFRELPVDPNE